MTQILIIDDEPDILDAVQRGLCDEGYDTSVACDGVEGLAAIQRHRPDLILLDISMPRMDGLQVCGKIRQNPDLDGVLILFLSGSGAVEDRLRGLDRGGDDYLVKPFDLRELVARVKALLRRSVDGSDAPHDAADDENCRLIVGDLLLDSNQRNVQLHGHFVQLTPAEFNLLHFLATHPNQVFSSEQLLSHVWGCSTGVKDTGLVRWHMKNLRLKLEFDPASPTYLRTIPRQGYIFVKKETRRPGDRWRREPEGDPGFAS